MINLEEVKIITICENTASDLEFIGEWGLSILVNTGDMKVLFDTGGGLSVLPNADHFNIQFSDIDVIVLSHGHVDHTGGLVSVLKRMHYEKPDKKIDIIAHPSIFDNKYYQRSQSENPFYEGVPFKINEIEQWGGNFILSEGPVILNDDIVTSGEIEMTNAFESVSPCCLVKKNNRYIIDNLCDDLALYLTTEMGLIVIAGCSHRGIINSLYHARKITGNNNIFMAMGGTHLVNVSEEQLKFTVREIQQLNVKKVGASHCTGMDSASYLASELGGVFFHNNAGSVVEFSGGILNCKS